MIRVFVLLCMFYIFIMPIVFLVSLNNTLFKSIKKKLVNIGIIKPNNSPLKINFNIYPRSIQ